jgi:hypothetical protein
MQFGEGLFDDLAEVTSFAGIDHDLSGLGHWGEFSKGGEGFPAGGGFLPQSHRVTEKFFLRFSGSRWGWESRTRKPSCRSVVLGSQI